MSFQNKMGEALKDLIEHKGEMGAIDIVRRTLKEGKMKPEDYSIKEMWTACVSEDAARKIMESNAVDLAEAIGHSAFPKLTGELINAKMIEGYNAIPTIGDELTQTVPSTVENETIVGLTALETPDEVGEGQEYPDSTFAEKYVTAKSRKFGRMISVTKEVITFDKKGIILQHAAKIGMKMNQWKERLVIRAIIDADNADTRLATYRPSGVPTALYAAANNNLITTNAFGESGMEAVRKNFLMKKDDSLGISDDDYIGPMVLANLQVLVPADLEMEAWQLANSLLTPESDENAANFFKGKFQVYTSPYVTQNHASHWYAGDFKQEFWWLEVWPIRTESQAAGHDDAFKRDIVTRHKVSMYGAPACIDTPYVIKCTA